MIAATPARAGAPTSQSLTSAPNGAPIAGTVATSLVDTLLGLSAAIAPGSDVPVRTAGGPGTPDILPFAQTLAAARAPQLSVSSPTVPELISAQVAPTPKAPEPPGVANAMPSPPLFAVPAWLKPALTSVDVSDRALAPMSTGGRTTAPRRTATPPSAPNDVTLGAAVSVPTLAGTPLTLTTTAGSPLDQPTVATDAAGAARRVRVAADNISEAGGRRGAEFAPGRAIAPDVPTPTVPDVAPVTSESPVPPGPAADPVAQLVQGSGLGDPSGGGGFKRHDDAADGGTASGPTSTTPAGFGSQRAPDFSSDSFASLAGTGAPNSHSVTPEARVVTLTFSAAHSDTRAALEQALPQLRDGFANAGLTLGQATVQQQMRQPSQNDTGAPKSDVVAADDVIGKSETRRVLSLVDEYV